MSSTLPRKSRILIVEDEPSFREALVRLLTRLGHEVRPAGTAREAFTQLAEWQPTSMILDLVLPDENGISILRKIRQENLPVRVAVVSGLSTTEDNPQFAQLKPDIYFTKPVDVITLAGWLGAAPPR